MKCAWHNETGERKNNYIHFSFVCFDKIPRIIYVRFNLLKYSLITFDIHRTRLRILRIMCVVRLAQVGIDGISVSLLLFVRNECRRPPWTLDIDILRNQTRFLIRASIIFRHFNPPLIVVFLRASVGLWLIIPASRV